ncbi:MAG: tetratricopeptide repeat protein [Pirellulales bacterium]|nr:tetratricopeptide repeat protein [Pirellulales bacterium]
MRRRLSLLPILTFFLLLIAFFVYSRRSGPDASPPQYVGRAECAECHEKEMKLYAGSDHDRSMDPAEPRFVSGDFNRRTYAHFGATSTMIREGDKFFMETDGPDGKPKKYGIQYAFGYRPLQQYLVEMPKGRVQCLPLAWDTEARKWFHLYPNEPIPHTDVLHWTRPLQNWNYMCAECHSTDLRKDYDPKTDTYRTRWSEIDVSCEACHGPASEHVRAASAWNYSWKQRGDEGLAKLKSPDPRVEIDACAPCHARRQVVYPGFTPGDNFLDYFLPEMLDGNLYYADGQILEEDYEYGSFLQSKMCMKQIRCTDCHDPHAMRLKGLAKDAPFKQVTNATCTNCHLGMHPAGKYDTAAHHHHPDATKPGTLCVDCHMPVTNYMVVDPRRDHSIRNPRPDLTVSLGIPNACTGCHHDAAKAETPAWAAAKVREWYGEKKEPKHFAYAIAAGRAGKPEGARLLEDVTRRKDLPPIVRASAVLLLARYPGTTNILTATDALEDPDGLVRTAGVRALLQAPPDVLHRQLAPLLRDPLRVVRTEAARIISKVPENEFNEVDKKAFHAALEEYLAGQRYLSDQPAAHLNVAVIHANRGRLPEAIAEYAHALKLDPEFVPARINLAMLHDQMGKKDSAEREFRKALEIAPKMAEAYYSLGLLIAEDEKRLGEAAEVLGKAVALAPENARMAYNHGLALQRLGRPEEAETALLNAYKLSGNQTEYLYALAVLYFQQEQWTRAKGCIEELIKRDPQNREFQALGAAIERREK